MSVNYTPGFVHRDWIDNSSLVQAAGDDGFNVRFHSLEDQFTLISTAISEISDAIDALSTVPPAKPVNLTLVPILTTINNLPWAQNQDGVVKPPSPATDCSGVMNVTLPTGAVIQSLRVIGAKQSGTLNVSLFRQSIVAGAIAQRIVGVDAQAGGFDQTVPAPATDLSKTDNDTFRYYLTARLSGANAGDSVSISVFQISYLNSH